MPKETFIEYLFSLENSQCPIQGREITPLKGTWISQSFVPFGRKGGNGSSGNHFIEENSDLMLAEMQTLTVLFELVRDVLLHSMSISSHGINWQYWKDFCSESVYRFLASYHPLSITLSSAPVLICELTQADERLLDV